MRYIQRSKTTLDLDGTTTEQFLQHQIVFGKPTLKLIQKQKGFVNGP